MEAAKTGEPLWPYPPDLPDEHRKYWQEITNCKPHDYYDVGDTVLLKMYCRCAYEVDKLSIDIAREGEVIRNARGNPVLNPKVVARSISETRLMTLAGKLGTQPSSRAVSEEQKDRGAKKKLVAKAAAQLLQDAMSNERGDDNLLAGSARMQ